MKLSHTLFLLVACGMSILLLTSCESTQAHHVPKPGIGKVIDHGPPAYDEVCGCRRTQIAGHELVYDAARDLYLVLDRPGCYFYEGYFYRFCHDMWQISLYVDSGWEPVAVAAVPAGLEAEATVTAQAENQPEGREEAKGWAKGT